MTSENLAADQKCLARVVSPKIVCNIMMNFFFQDKKGLFICIMACLIPARDKVEMKGSSSKLPGAAGF